MNLSEKPVGFSGVIVNLCGPELIVARLKELGFIPGETIEIKRRVSFGDPVIIQVRSATIALRREEAQCILI